MSESWVHFLPFLLLLLWALWRAGTSFTNRLAPIGWLETSRENCLPLKLLSVFEASCSAFHAVLDQIRPHKRSHSSIVVAVRQIVIQCGKTMLLEGFFMPGELPSSKLCLSMFPQS